MKGDPVAFPIISRTKLMPYISWLCIGSIILLIFSSSCSTSPTEQKTENDSDIVKTATTIPVHKIEPESNIRSNMEAPLTSTPVFGIPGKITGKVVNVLDGVTIEIGIGKEVYIVSYQYLELPLPSTSNSDIGDLRQASLKLNEYLVLGKSVEIEVPVDKISEKNTYEGLVYSKGELVNKILLESGLARLSGKASTYQELHGFVKAQNEAMKAMRGIWAEPSPNDNTLSVTQSSTTIPTIIIPFTGGTLPKRPKTK